MTTKCFPGLIAVTLIVLSSDCIKLFRMFCMWHRCIYIQLSEIKASLGVCQSNYSPNKCVYTTMY